MRMTLPEVVTGKGSGTPDGYVLVAMPRLNLGEEMIKFVSIEMHLREILYLIDYCDCQVNLSFVGFSKYKLLRSNGKEIKLQ